MENKNKKTKLSSRQKISENKNNLTGYPLYPESDDIYSKSQEEMDMDPDDITKIKKPNEKVGTRNERDFCEDVSGSDLDVPGSELDDMENLIGDEDEENDFYSLGGDDHNDLDEEK